MEQGTKTFLFCICVFLLAFGYIAFCLSSVNWISVKMQSHDPYMEVQHTNDTYLCTWWGGRNWHLVKAINISTPDGDIILVDQPEPGTVITVTSSGPVTVYGQDWDRRLWHKIGESDGE